ncbi:protoheme IX farnesyltransferase [Rugamonas sp. FT81W]|uniref:Protoheme IX farnesyltransferase n=2 Tax=Duganella vulcania TaxID=2692166 RepID=A0A845GRM8_9BURK|nr:protoheme IX farnesyltransferase [Duganella vulcania]
MSRAYLSLTKPGIVLGNLISVTGGFLLATHGQVDWKQGALVASGVSLIVASGCTVNNVIDRDIDRLMLRTRRRPMASGAVAIPAALGYAALLLLVGVGVLYTATQRLLPLMLVLLGYAVYVGLYTLCLKRQSVHGTLIGSISGAMPPVVGYCAVQGGFDVTALMLLVMFSLWQMPHSYAIAIFRDADYRAAAIPVLPMVRGYATAKRHIILYIIAFMIASLSLGALGAGGLYMLSMLVAGAGWLAVAIAGLTTRDDTRWARKVFITSIAVVTVMSTAMSLHAI